MPRESRVYLGVTRHDTMRHDTTRHDTTRHETQESILVSRDMCLGVLRHMPRRVVSPLPPSVYLCLSGRVAAHVSWCRDVSCRVCRLLCLCVCRVCRVMCACGVATYICLDITWSCRLVTHPCLVVSCVSASVCVCGCLRRTRIAYRSHVLSCRACLHLSLYVLMSLSLCLSLCRSCCLSSVCVCLVATHLVVLRHTASAQEFVNCTLFACGPSTLSSNSFFFPSFLSQPQSVAQSLSQPHFDCLSGYFLGLMYHLIG